MSRRYARKRAVLLTDKQFSMLNFIVGEHAQKMKESNLTNMQDYAGNFFNYEEAYQLCSVIFNRMNRKY